MLLSRDVAGDIFYDFFLLWDVCSLSVGAGGVFLLFRWFAWVGGFEVLD